MDVANRVRQFPSVQKYWMMSAFDNFQDEFRVVLGAEVNTHDGVESTGMSMDRVEPCDVAGDSHHMPVSSSLPIEVSPNN